MFAILVVISFMHGTFLQYKHTFIEAFESVNIDKNQIFENVSILRDAVINQKEELMRLMLELETLIQRTVVLETSGFLSADEQTKLAGEPECGDVKQFQDFELSNDQIENLYQNYMMHMQNIKQFKSSMFMTMAAIRSKINMLEPDLSYESLGLDSEDVEEGETENSPLTVTDASMEKHDQRISMMKEIENMMEELRNSLDAFYDDFRKMSQIARQMRCVNGHMLELVHGKEKKENFVLYQLAKI
tara:strand:+ start:1169 stop:1903 length:735 start_codon:yes stop_codon:yes gene_type:complete